MTDDVRKSIVRRGIWTCLLIGLAISTCTTNIRAEAADDPQANSAAKSDAWRYRRHDGLWWYWTVANRWVYWSDGRWVDYDPKTYAEFRASRASQTSTPRGQGDWGQWGPVRYNRFGQPQYPYSQRTRGMRQLGPVPTPAGLRSLPGWGGER